MHERQTGVAAAQTFHGSDAAMSGAVVHDPEDTTGIVVGWSCHDLVDQSIKGCDAIFGFTTAENSGVMHVEGGDIGPGAAAKIFVFDVHGGAGAAVLRGMFAAAGLNTRLLVGRDDELIRLQRLSLPLAGIQVEHATGLGGKIRIAREDPTPVIPGANGVLVEPPPQGTAANRGDQATLLDLLYQIGGAPARERPTVLRR